MRTELRLVNIDETTAEETIVFRVSSNGIVEGLFAPSVANPTSQDGKNILYTDPATGKTAFTANVPPNAPVGGTFATE